MILTILALTAITFSTRYLFLEKHFPLRLGPLARRALSFSGPAVLSAIAAPILLVHNGAMQWQLNNPYLWGGLVAIATARATRSIYATMLLAGFVFVALKWWWFA